MLETESHCIDDEVKVQSVTDTDNEFTERLRKKLQSTGISPVSLHILPQHSRINNAKMKLDKVMNTIKSYISEAYKVQLTFWKIQSLIPMIKMI